MYRYDPAMALEELAEESALPNPVHVRDMILRAHPQPRRALELNRKFVEYQKAYGELMAAAREMLSELSGISARPPAHGPE